MGIWRVHITFSCLPNRQDGTLIVFVTLFPEVELIHKKDTCLKQRCALQKEVWFQKENNTQQPEFRLNHLPSFIQKWSVGLSYWGWIIYRTKVRLMPKQSSLYFQYQGYFGVPVAHLRNPACHLLARKVGLREWQACYYPVLRWVGENVTFEGELHQCLGGEPCCEHKREQRDVLAFIHNIWGHGCMDGSGYLPVHTGLCAWHVLNQS